MDTMNVNSEAVKKLHRSGRTPTISNVTVARSTFDDNHLMTVTSLKALNFCDATLTKVLNGLSSEDQISVEDTQRLIATTLSAVWHTVDLQWRTYFNQVLAIRDATLFSSPLPDQTKLRLRDAPVVKTDIFGPFAEIARKEYDAQLAKERKERPKATVVKISAEHLQQAIAKVQTPKKVTF